MAHKSDYLEDKIINHVLRNTTYTSPTTVYAALYTTAPTDAAGGTEVSGTGYARKSITFSAPSPSGTTTNSNLIDYGTAGSAWGTVVAVGIFDASTSGNLLYWNTCTNKTIASGDGVTIPIGDLDLTED